MMKYVQEIYDSAEHAIKELKLDRRRKWEVFRDGLYYPHRYTAPCSGCSCDCSDGYGCSHGNSGCEECGYTGKRRDVVPIPAIGKNGNPILIKINP